CEKIQFSVFQTVEPFDVPEKAAVKKSAVCFSHDEIQAAEDGDDVADHVTREDFGKNAQVDKRGSADFEAVGDPTALAVDVKSEFTLGVFRSEVNFSGRSVDALGGHDEVMDEFLHLGEHLDFW